MIIIDSFNNKVNPIYDTMRVMGGLNWRYPYNHLPDYITSHFWPCK